MFLLTNFLFVLLRSSSQTGSVTSKAVVIPEAALEQAKNFLLDSVLKRICSYVEPGTGDELEEMLATKGKKVKRCNS